MSTIKANPGKPYKIDDRNFPNIFRFGNKSLLTLSVSETILTSVKTVTDANQLPEEPETVNVVKSISDFATELGVHRQVIAVIVRNHELETVPMQHGVAKGLPPKTQRAVKKHLGIKPARVPA